MSGVEIRVRSNSTQARRDLTQLERSIQNIDRTTSGVTRTFRNLALSITAALGAAGAVRSITTAADSITDLGNRVALVVGRGQELETTLGSLYAVAARARVPVNTTADVFNRFGLALSDSGASVSELLTVTEAVGKAATISGASAASAEAAIIQLGQGLASGELRGEELNSVLEQIPRLARAIADGMGIPFGELRAAAKDGQLTATEVFNAIISESQNIESEFQGLDATIGSLTNTLRDEFTRALGALDREFGFSDKLETQIIAATEALRFFADNLESWVTLTQAKFRIFLNNVILFREDVKDNFNNLFTFDSEISLDNFYSILDTISTAYNERLGYLTDPIVLKIEELDLERFIPSLEDVKATLASFTSFVEGLFESLYYAISGDSWWGEIFWEGQNRIGGPKFTAALDSVQQQLSTWSESIGNYFEILYNRVSTSWNDLVDALTNRTIETPRGPQVVQSGFGEFIDKALETGGNIYVDVSQRAVDFFNSVKESDEDTLLGRLLNLMSEGKNFIEVNSGPQFDATVETLSLAIASLRNSPIIKSLSAAATGITEFYEGGRVAASSFIEEISNSTDAIAAIFVAALITASKIGFKGLALAVTSVVFAPEILNSDNFQNSAKSLAKGFGQILKQVLTGEGDYGAALLEGLSENLTAIGDGFIDGLFGEENDFTGRFADGFTGALIVGVGLVTLIGPLRAAVIALGSRIVSVMLGSAIVAEFAAGLAIAITNGLGLGTLVGSAAAWRGAAGSLGLTIGTAIQVGIIGGVVAGLAIGLKSALDSVTQNAVDAVDRTIRDETAEQQAERRAQEIISARDPEAAIRYALEQGTINLEVLSDEAISELAAAVSGMTASNDTWLDRLSDLIGTMDTNSGAINTLTTELARRNLDYSQFENQTNRYATGGFVNGPGTSTSDSIPALLSNGEFVMQAKSVEKFGPRFFALLNKGLLPKFSGGGYVTPFDDEIATLSNQIELFTTTDASPRAIQRSESILNDLLDLRRRYIIDNYGDSAADLEELGGGMADSAGEKKKGDKKQTPGQSFAERFANDFQSGLTEAISTGDFKSFGLLLLDSFTMSVIGSFSQGLTDALFGGLIGEDGAEGPLAKIFSGISGWASGLASGVGESITTGLEDTISDSGVNGGLFGGIRDLFSGGGLFGSLFSGLLGLGGGGGLFSSLFGLSFGSFLGFSSGGIVPSTSYSREGVDSVPAMLTPGELVVPANKVGDFQRGGSNQTVVNLSITGDISRQTRAEIIKMLPTIAGGVNAQNRENNFKYR